MTTLTKLSDSTKYAFFSAGIVMVSLIGVYLVVEPTVSRAISDVFTISQNITDEISFSTPVTDVQMVGGLNGLTGGNATGTTFVVVQTNDVLGYNMTIDFSSAPAMNSTTTSDVIFDYKMATGTPDFNFVASSSAIFAYTVNASTTTDVDPTFRDNGVFCGGGNGNLVDRCWYGPSTTPEMIINRGSSAPSGATTTIKFRVYVPNTPVPTLDAAYYQATATLTALNN